MLVGLVALSVRTLWCTSPERVVLAGDTMGTTWGVTLNAPGLPRAAPAELREAIDLRLAAINAAMSTWDPESELSRLNRSETTESVAVGAELARVLGLARQVSEASGGVFDVTVGPLVAAWGFGAGARIPGEGPSPEELVALRARVGWEKLEIDAGAATVRKAVPGVQADLSAIAKGHAVDEVARLLHEAGHQDFLVEIGGEVAARGERVGGGAWRVAIERPHPEGRAAHAVVELGDLAMATSGDYRDFYEAGGERLTHVVDPRIGRPVAHGLASVSVVHPRAALADAWATTLLVLGPEAGPEAAAQAGLGAYFIRRGEGGAFSACGTPGFPTRLDPAGAPVVGEVPCLAGAID